MTYEELLLFAHRKGIEVWERDIGRLKGLCVNNIITINRNIKDNREKRCILCEEIGHYLTTRGNILDQSREENRQQERRARGWAYQTLIPLDSLINAYNEGVSGCFELAEFLYVTEYFLIEAINYYKEKCGLYYIIDNYIIYFDPLGVEKTKGGEQVVNL